jgi:hypothetical protein
VTDANDPRVLNALLRNDFVSFIGAARRHGIDDLVKVEVHEKLGRVGLRAGRAAENAREILRCGLMRLNGLQGRCGRRVAGARRPICNRRSPLSIGFDSSYRHVSASCHLITSTWHGASSTRRSVVLPISRL